MIGPTILHHEKTADTFVNALVAIAGKAKLRNLKFDVITDGEVALTNARKNSFPKSIDLRCTKHFLENCKNFSKSNGIRSEVRRLTAYNRHFCTVISVFYRVNTSLME